MTMDSFRAIDMPRVSQVNLAHYAWFYISFSTHFDSPDFFFTGYYGLYFLQDIAAFIFYRILRPLFFTGYYGLYFSYFSSVTIAAQAGNDVSPHHECDSPGTTALKSTFQDVEESQQSGHDMLFEAEVEKARHNQWLMLMNNGMTEAEADTFQSEPANIADLIEQVHKNLPTPKAPGNLYEHPYVLFLDPQSFRAWTCCNTDTSNMVRAWRAKMRAKREVDTPEAGWMDVWGNV